MNGLLDDFGGGIEIACGHRFLQQGTGGCACPLCRLLHGRQGGKTRFGVLPLMVVVPHLYMSAEEACPKCCDSVLSGKLCLSHQILKVPYGVPKHHGAHEGAEDEHTDGLEPALSYGIVLQVDRRQTEARIQRDHVCDEITQGIKGRGLHDCCPSLCVDIHLDQRNQDAHYGCKPGGVCDGFHNGALDDVTGISQLTSRLVLHP
mmetsp:Transcript_46530/g.101411  ORF Transcript_46530/g.101411 Transcript_46530/m.101411 type:complete len:204 (+) Transcript_46530:693-1304(+)